MRYGEKKYVVCSLCVASARPSALVDNPHVRCMPLSCSASRRVSGFSDHLSVCPCGSALTPRVRVALSLQFSCPCRLSNVIRSWKYTVDFVCMWCAIFLSRKKLGSQSDRGRHALHTGVILVRITTNPGFADFFSQLGMSVRRLEQR